MDDIKKYRAELKEWYKKEKSTKHCIICEKRKFLQYHHIVPAEKFEGIARMVHKGYPKEIIIAEMEKCEIMCRSCHCKIHARIKRERRNSL